MRGFAGLILTLVVLLAPAFAWAMEGKIEAGGVVVGQVATVVDGDTLTLMNGLKVRLLDIDTPEIFHDGRGPEDGALAAKRTLELMVAGREIRVELGKRPMDTYGRLLGHVFVAHGGNPRGNWVNGVLVREGLAHVYTFEDNGIYGRKLLELEAGARGAQRGIWRLPRWAVRDAATCCDSGEAGRYMLVEGRVASVGYGDKGMVYLNFGVDYRRDFTVRIEGRNKRKFEAAWGADEAVALFLAGGVTNAARAKGRELWAELDGLRVRVRGKLMPVNGMMVEATHPLQLVVLGK